MSPFDLHARLSAPEGQTCGRGGETLSSGDITELFVLRGRHLGLDLIAQLVLPESDAAVEMRIVVADDAMASEVGPARGERK